MVELPYHNLEPRKAIPSYWNPPDDGPEERLYLHLGESPFPPTPNVVEAICRAAESVNYYPDTNAVLLRRDLADYVGHGVTPENIIVGNGSDDLIQLIFQTFLPRRGKVFTLEPTFFYYGFCSARLGAHYIPLVRESAPDYDLPPMGEILTFVFEVAPNIIFLANPNNPTGALVDEERVSRLIARAPHIIVVDECYFEFCSQTVVEQIHTCKKLIVLRSLSKSFSLAGVRVGYAVACRELIEAMENMALTFPVNAIAQAAARTALRETDIMKERVEKTRMWRNKLSIEILSLGLDVSTSHTNFLLISSGGSIRLADDCAERLAQKGILVSDQSATPGMEGTAIRVTVTDPGRIQRLVGELRRCLV